MDWEEILECFTDPRGSQVCTLIGDGCFFLTKIISFGRIILRDLRFGMVMCMPMHTWLRNPTLEYLEARPGTNILSMNYEEILEFQAYPGLAFWNVILLPIAQNTLVWRKTRLQWVHSTSTYYKFYAIVLGPRHPYNKCSYKLHWHTNKWRHCVAAEISFQTSLDPFRNS